MFDSAATLFAKGGFDGVSVDDIARDAGVNKAMIYYHFADKLALYRAVVAYGLEPDGRDRSRHRLRRRHAAQTSSIASSKPSCA